MILLVHFHLLYHSLAEDYVLATYSTGYEVHSMSTFQSTACDLLIMLQMNMDWVVELNLVY